MSGSLSCRRERVKRKRAQKMKEAQRNSPDVSTDGIEQTDLTELSKGLPSGWQVLSCPPFSFQKTCCN